MLVRMTGRNMKSNKSDYTQGGDSALIHLNVPKALKGRWVQASRSEGKKLSEWIIDIVEQHMGQRLVRIAIPDDITFNEVLAEEKAGQSFSYPAGKA